MWGKIWALQTKKDKFGHDSGNKIKTKHKAEKSGGIRENRQRKDTVKLLPWRILPLLSHFDSQTCDSQLRNYAQGCMGPKEHRTPAGTNTKRNLQRTRLTLAHTHALTLLNHAALSSFIPSSHPSSHALSRSLFCGCFIHINGVWVAALQKGRRRGTMNLPPFIPSCIDLHHPDADFSKWSP